MTSGNLASQVSIVSYIPSHDRKIIESSTERVLDVT